MMFVMLVAGIGLVLAGLLAIGFGIPIKEFSTGTLAGLRRPRRDRKPDAKPACREKKLEEKPINKALKNRLLGL